MYIIVKNTNDWKLDVISEQAQLIFTLPCYPSGNQHYPALQHLLTEISVISSQKRNMVVIKRIEAHDVRFPVSISAQLATGHTEESH